MTGLDLGAERWEKAEHKLLEAGQVVPEGFRPNYSPINAGPSLLKLRVCDGGEIPS